MQKDRVDYLDFIKGVSIMFVVFCHNVVLSNETIVGNILMAMAWGAVPCFFMVTGGIMHSKTTFSWKGYYNRICKVYVVLVIWKIIYFIYFGIMQHCEYTKSQLLEYIFLFNGLEGVSDGHMWFIYAYISILLLYPISYILLKIDGVKIFVFMIVLFWIGGMGRYSCNLVLEILSKMGYGNLQVTNIGNVIPFGTYQNMMFYFCIGALLFNYREKILEARRKVFIVSICFILIGTIGLLLIKYYQTQSFTWSGTYLENGYKWNSTILLSVGMYLLAMSLKETKITHIIAKGIGTKTLGIFYLHILVLNWLIKNFPLDIQYYSCLANILKTFIVILICELLIMIIGKIPILKELV